MHVVIVGAGEVGWYLAQEICAEPDLHVVVVEQNEAIAAAIGAELDVQVVIGSATLPSTLQAARIDRADLLVAVTQNDEVNLIASLLAKEAGVSQTVVRIQTEELRSESGASLRAAMRADVVIDPDADTADEIMELATLAGADEVYQMSGGDLIVLGCKIGEGSALAGSTLAEIGASFEPDWSFLFGTVTQKSETVIPRGDRRLEVGDHVRVLTSRKDGNKILELLGASHRRAKRVMVLGGGAVGSRVAERLQVVGADVVLVERDFDRARLLSERLPQITVVRGDIEDIDLLSEERISDKDLVIAATGDDAANVLACAFAATGCDTDTMAVIHRLSLLPLVRQFRINAALTPRIASANAVFKHLRSGTASVSTFLGTNIEVDEIEIEVGSKADGAVVSELHLPHSIVLGAVIRPGEPGRIIRGYTVLKAGDNVVVFARPESLPGLRKVFSA